MKTTGVIPGIVASRPADAALVDTAHPPEQPSEAASPAPEAKPQITGWALNIDRPVTIGGCNGVPAKQFTSINIDQQDNGHWDFSVDFAQQLVWAKWDTGSAIAIATVPLSWCAIRWRVTA